MLVLSSRQRGEAVEIITKGKGVVGLRRRHAMAELSDSVVDLAVGIAGKIIGNELSIEQQRALAERKYLAEVGTQLSTNKRTIRRKVEGLYQGAPGGWPRRGSCNGRPQYRCSTQRVLSRSS